MWFMTLRIALRALARNKLRSFLTMLGIIIGVGAVIAMVAIGEGAKATIRSQIASLGTNVLIVLPGTTTHGGVRAGFGSVSTVTDGDVENDAKVAVLGETVVRNLFGNDDPLDSVIRIRNIPFRVVGVLAAKGQSSQGADQDDTVLIPYTSMQKRLMRITNVQTIIASAVSADRVQEAQEQITLLLRQRHRIQPDREDDFFIRNLSDIAEAASSSARVMAVLLGAVASISLLVGGIGIMNIMLVSVTERTREIGIRMAVGARSRDIMLQFLVEAVVMAATGGGIGILLGIGSSEVLKFWANWPTLVSPTIVAIAFLFSGAVGIFFGFYPAQKAANLDPIDALRYE